MNAGQRRELYYFRDQQGLEVDFVVPGKRGKGGVIRLIEAKATRTPTPDMAASMRRLAQAFGSHSNARRAIEMLLVYQPPRQPVDSRALAPGVQALTWQQLVTDGASL